MREKAREVIENEISYFVGQSQKRTDSTAEVLKSLSELENAEASKPTIQLPKVAHLNVDFEPLLMQAQVRVIKCFYKRGYVFQMVIWSAFRMRQYRVKNHPYRAPQFILCRCNFCPCT